MLRFAVIAAPLLAVTAVATPAKAHGFGDRYDLPVPLSLWVAGAALAVVLSFVAIGVFVRGAAPAERYPRTNLLRWKAARLLVHPRVWLAGQIVSIALLVLIVAAGVVGTQNPVRNLAPTAIWVVWWVGFAYLSALVGDVWKVVNPWSALFALVERPAGGGFRAEPRVAYLRALGAWPAVVLFGAFAWMALVFDGRAIPAQLALITIGYSVITWTGMAIFGRLVWLGHGDPFAVAFGLLARFAPTELRVTSADRCRRCEGECELNLRPFAAGLPPDPGPARDPARLRPVRVRLEPLRHGRLPSGHRPWMRGASGTRPSWRSSAGTSLRSTSRASLRSGSLPTTGPWSKVNSVVLVLMVGYTTASLWIIAQPIVESRGAG